MNTAIPNYQTQIGIYNFLQGDCLLVTLVIKPQKIAEVLRIVYPDKHCDCSKCKICIFFIYLR